MAYKITVSNLENGTSWEKPLTKESYEIVKGQVKGCEVVSIPSALLKPVRTNNLKSFAQDFFLPTLVNHAIKIEDAVGKIFAVLGALILDTLTFPFRLLTCIPRILTNACRGESPLKKYLLSENVPPKLLEAEHVKVTLQRERIDEQDKGWAVNKWHVNFIEVPEYEGHNGLESMGYFF